MKTKESEFLIDKAIAKYQELSTKEKTIIHLALMVTLVFFTIGSFYNAGEAVGVFFYNITH